MESQKEQNSKLLGQIFSSSLENLVVFLGENDFKNICIQSDNEFLTLCSSLVEFIRGKSKKDYFFFTLGETNYGSCCVDEAAARHLPVDLIIRLGRSCLTKPPQVPVYFVYPEKTLDVRILDSWIYEYIKGKDSEDFNLFIIYDFVFFYSFKDYELEKDKTAMKEFQSRIQLPQVNFQANLPQNEENTTGKFNIANRFYDKEISKGDHILFIGDDTDSGGYDITQEDWSKLLFELSLQRSKVNPIVYTTLSSIQKGEKELKSLDQPDVNSIFFSRYQLISKASECQVFGILIGNLNLPELNPILSMTKSVLIKHSKKYYTFLLGKLTDEKLSNFVEYIDCFVLIACPFTSFTNKKALMKPIVNPIDLLIAFKEKEWDLNYSFNPVFALDSFKSNEDSIKEIKSQKFLDSVTSLQALEGNEKNALSLIFSSKVLEHYEDRKFKGLDVKEQVEVKKITKGKRGIPIHYEDIKD